MDSSTPLLGRSVSVSPSSVELLPVQDASSPLPPSRHAQYARELLDRVSLCSSSKPKVPFRASTWL